MQYERIMKKATAIIFFLVFWFAFLGASGTLTSGFHFTDDHQIIYFDDALQLGAGAFESALGWIANDASSGRFLPLYYFHRLLEIKLFGTDFLAWGIYDGILAWAASALLAVSLLLWGCSLLEAILMPLILFMGFQSAVWWRFGTAETIAMPLVGVMLLAAVLGARKKGILPDVVFILAGLLLMLAKENFILFIPALLFLKVWMSKSGGDGWAGAARKNILPVVFLLALSAAGILFIKFFVGTTGIGYAGYDGFRIAPFIAALINYSFAGHAWLVPAGVALALATAPREKRIFLSEILPSLIVLFLAVAPQALIYAKSGVSERYILPGAFGFAFTSVYMLKLVRENLSSERPAFGVMQLAGWAVALGSLAIGAWMISSPKLGLTFNSESLGVLSGIRQVPAIAYAAAFLHGISGKTLFWAGAVVMVLSFAAVKLRGLRSSFNQRTFLSFAMVWAALFSASLGFDKAFLSAFQGWNTNEWLTSIEKNTSKESVIMVVADPAINNEWALSIKRYLELKSGRPNLYIYPVLTRPAYSQFDMTLMDSLEPVYEGKSIKSLPDKSAVDAVVIFPNAEERLLAGSSDWFDPAQFRRYANEYGFASYYRAAPHFP